MIRCWLASPYYLYCLRLAALSQSYLKRLYIDNKTVSGIPPPAIVGILNRLADRPETRTRVKQRISAVFAFAIQTGRAALSAPKTVRSARNNHLCSLGISSFIIT